MVDYKIKEMADRSCDLLELKIKIENIADKSINDGAVLSQLFVDLANQSQQVSYDVAKLCDALDQAISALRDIDAAYMGTPIAVARRTKNTLDNIDKILGRK